MKKLIPILLTIGLLGCSWLDKAPKYTPLQVCTTVCSIQAVMDAKCMEGGTEYWALFQNVYDTTECLAACSNSYSIFEDIDPACLGDLFLSVGIDDIGCPDLSVCIK